MMRVSSDVFFDPASIEHNGSHYRVFESFLDRGPLHKGAPPFEGAPEAIYVFSRRLAEEMLSHPEILEAPEGPYTEARAKLVRHAVFAILTQTMLHSDPPRHGQLRRPMAKVFSASRLAELEPEIQALARRHADRCFNSGRFDLIKDFAAPFVVGVLSKVFGVEIESVDWLKARTACIASAFDFDWRKSRATHATSTADFGNGGTMEAANRACLELRDFIESIIASRVTPLPESALSVMLALERDGSWSHDDVVNACIFFLFAGQETVVDAIGNSALVLAHYADRRDELRDQPALCGAAVEELLRFESPVQYVPARIPANDVVLDGYSIEAGRPIIAVLASANRDPAWCERPHELDFHRPATPRSLAFGAGIHTCLGHHLARLELRAALETLYTPTINWHLLTEQVVRRPNIVFRGVVRAPAVVES